MVRHVYRGLEHVFVAHKSINNSQSLHKSDACDTKQKHVQRRFCCIHFQRVINSRQVQEGHCSLNSFPNYISICCQVCYWIQYKFASHSFPHECVDLHWVPTVIPFKIVLYKHCHNPILIKLSGDTMNPHNLPTHSLYKSSTSWTPEALNRWGFHCIYLFNKNHVMSVFLFLLIYSPQNWWSHHSSVLWTILWHKLPHNYDQRHTQDFQSELGISQRNPWLQSSCHPRPGSNAEMNLTLWENL